MFQLSRSSLRMRPPLSIHSTGLSVLQLQYPIQIRPNRSAYEHTISFQLVRRIQYVRPASRKSLHPDFESKERLLISSNPLWECFFLIEDFSSLLKTTRTEVRSTESGIHRFFRLPRAATYWRVDCTCFSANALLVKTFSLLELRTSYRSMDCKATWTPLSTELRFY